LRNAVANGRQGHAYLFSGPRGTGKTSTARILAKVLNCENPHDGEPCCECASCVSVEAGTSFDVHELDAASNNGVEAMRELIDKAMLGTPGRHKVYILDEVHMLSKGAEGALLKTLEEPPSHVVFVLATTDPQKVSETIRSRTQPFQFHLLPMDVMADHIRWLASDANLELDEDALDAVLRQGGGSARDTISSLEVVLASGGVAPDETPLDEFIESLIESDPGRALAAVAASIRQGRDARVLTESIVAHLRDCFLCLMAPELVALTAHRASEVGQLAERLGAASTVRSIETLGTILVEMRHAPDPRVLLEVALVKLTMPSVEGGLADLSARLAKLERAVAAGAIATSAAPAGSSSPASSSAASSGAAVPGSATPRAAFGSRARREPMPATSPAPTAPVRQADPPAARLATAPPPTTSPAATSPAATSPAAPAATSPAVTSPTVSQGAPPGGHAQLWQSVSSTLRPIARGVYGSGHLVDVKDGVATFVFPSEGLRRKGDENRTEVEAALSSITGSPVRLNVIVGATTGQASDDPSPMPPRAVELQADDDIDLTELVDAPRGPVISPIDRIAAAFPGVKLGEES
jgi:DNA polymerase III subunit gamma/tau